MKMIPPQNANYAATVVQIDRLVDLTNCSNVRAAIIFGSQVIVSKDVRVGDVGLYFPVECRLSESFLASNNLYRHSNLNVDKSKTGFFDENGRVRCVKFRGHQSEGFLIPLASLMFIGDIDGLKVGDEFDCLGDIPICCKYIPKHRNTTGTKNAANKKIVKRVSCLVQNQFRLYVDTATLAKHIHAISPDDSITITNKLHGTSWVVGQVLTKRRLNWFERILKRLGAKIEQTSYDTIYSSRNRIKNDFIDTKPKHWYGYDLWGQIAEMIEPSLTPGLSLYGECVGFTKSGGFIQKGYGYGCEPNKFDIYLYHATYTNPIGKILSLSWNQLKEFCNRNNLKHVPEFYAGKAKDLYRDIPIDENWHRVFFDRIKNDFNLAGDQMCSLNMGKVPSEGFVVKVETLDDCVVFKNKGSQFRLFETKLLDEQAKSGEVDMETQESLTV